MVTLGEAASRAYPVIVRLLGPCLLVLLTQAGCSLLFAMDDFASDAPSHGDGGTDAEGPDVEAGTFDAPESKGDASVDAGEGENLHPNGTFETTCSPFRGFMATVEVSDAAAHEQSRSCMVCATEMTGFFTADDLGVADAPPGSTFRAEAWVHAAPGRPAPTATILVLRSVTYNPFTEVEKVDAFGPAPSTTWTRVAVDLPITKTAAKINVVVGGPAAANACFLLDDVRLTRVR